MSLLAPLGLLGFIGVAILILIYLLKPNYQQKFISSTFVWKLSLKYRKKRIPINRFRNLILLLCQILVITSCAFILAKPVVKAEEPKEYTEKIAIIDASGSMLSVCDNETRFKRAVTQVKTLAGEVAGENGFMSVILAGKEAEFIAQRTSAESVGELYEKLDDLIKPNAEKCTYGEGDIDGAIALAESVLAENSESEVLLYTGNRYIDAGSITVKDVSQGSEWNGAILDVQTELVENYYDFTVTVATYGISTTLVVYCEVFDANGGRINEHDWYQPIQCVDGEEKTFTFNAETMGEDRGIYEYDRVYFYIKDINDSFAYDNTYYLYGGSKPVIKIQYASSVITDFFAGVLKTAQRTFSSRWDIQIDEVENKKDIQTEGYDFYIFEHELIPSTLPADGVVFLVDPYTAPEAAGVSVSSADVSGNFYFARGEEHAIMEGLTCENIGVTKYKRITPTDTGYKTLMYCGGDPVFIVKDEPYEKIAVLSVDLNRSTASMLIEFPLLFCNLFNYYLPSTLTEFAFDVDETVRLNARGEVLNISSPDGTKLTIEEFPSDLTLSAPGTYTLTQELMSSQVVIESLYVKVSAEQSNIKKTYDALNSPYVEEKAKPVDLDLLIYFASALVGLVFIEWLLQSREM